MATALLSNTVAMAVDQYKVAILLPRPNGQIGLEQVNVALDEAPSREVLPRGLMDHVCKLASFHPEECSSLKPCISVHLNHGACVGSPYRN